MILTDMVSAMAYASVSDPTVSIFSFYTVRKEITEDDYTYSTA